jgi:hypothetical protein
MAITQAVANSFKKELLEGVHKFQYTSGDTFKLALYYFYCNVKLMLLQLIQDISTGNRSSVIVVTMLVVVENLVKPNPSTSVASGVAIVTFC